MKTNEQAKLGKNMMACWNGPLGFQVRYGLLSLPLPAWKPLDGISGELNVTNHFRQLVSVETKSFTEALVFVATHSALCCSYLDSLHLAQLQVFHLAACWTSHSVCSPPVALCVMKVAEEGWHAHSPASAAHGFVSHLSFSLLEIGSIWKHQPTVICWRQL